MYTLEQRLLKFTASEKYVSEQPGFPLFNTLYNYENEMNCDSDAQVSSEQVTAFPLEPGSRSGDWFNTYPAHIQQVQLFFY